MEFQERKVEYCSSELSENFHCYMCDSEVNLRYNVTNKGTPWYEI